NFERHVCLQVIPCFVQLGVGIDHRRGAVVGGIEDVEITVGVRLQQDAEAITFAKHALRIDTDSETIRVAHEQRHTKTHPPGIYWSCRFRWFCRMCRIRRLIRSLVCTLINNLVRVAGTGRFRPAPAAYPWRSLGARWFVLGTRRNKSTAHVFILYCGRSNPNPSSANTNQSENHVPSSHYLISLG